MSLIKKCCFNDVFLNNKIFKQNILKPFFNDDFSWQMTPSKVEDSSTGPISYSDSAGNLVTIPAETPIYIDRGYWNIGSFHNYLENPLSPATQTTGTLGVGNYTLWNRGGSVAVSAGTATITGSGVATEGNPLYFTVTIAGTVNVAVSGACTVFQLTGTKFSTEPFLSTSVSTVASRAGTIAAPIEVGDRLYSLLDGDKGFKLSFKWTPNFRYSDIPVSTTKSILYSGTQSILQFRTDAAGNGYLDLKDGTNTSSVALDWEYGVSYDIEMLFGNNVAESANKMQLIVDSTASTLSAFDGSLNPDTEMAIGYNNDYMFKITPPKFYTLKQSDWIANPNGYLFSIVESLVVSGTISTNGSVTIDWGDGYTNTYSGGTDIAYSHTYSSIGLYHVTSGQKEYITKFVMNKSDCKLVCNTSDFPVNLTLLNLSITQSVITGGASDFPVNLNYLNLYNTKSVITGGASDFPVNLTLLNLYNAKSVIDSYTSKIWPPNMRYLYLYTVLPGGLNSTEVDNLLIDLASTTWTIEKKIYILGTNAARTSASDAAVATLISKGVSVTTN